MEKVDEKKLKRLVRSAKAMRKMLKGFEYPIPDYKGCEMDYCAYCGGWSPSDKNEYNASQYEFGHKEGCYFVQTIKEANAALRDIQAKEAK